LVKAGGGKSPKRESTMERLNDDLAYEAALMHAYNNYPVKTLG